MIYPSYWTYPGNEIWYPAKRSDIIPVPGDFWSGFPSDPKAFARVARKGWGIRISFNSAPGTGRPLQSEYRGVRTHILLCMLEGWLTDSVSFLRSSSLKLGRAMQSFEKDRMLDWLVVSGEFCVKFKNLPRPPAGYNWVPFGNGYRWSGAHVCRLWNPKLGRMRF